MIIDRPEELRKLKTAKKWMLIYGRRKTGKTFLVENYLDYDMYFFVNRDRTIILKTEGNRMIGYEAFIELLRVSLEANKTIVVDEFHRLGDQFFDLLHSMKKNGSLILITSTMFLAKRLLSSGSPILGAFQEIMIPLISLGNALNAVKGLGKKEMLESAIIMREPIVIDYFSAKSARATLVSVLLGSLNAVPALIGEIFEEEDRRMSAIYNGIMGAVATGHTTSGEITDHLFERKLLKNNDPSLVQQYLDNLIKIGVLRRIGVYGKKRYEYRMDSPLVRLFYYADEKYAISQRRISEEEAIRIVDEVMLAIVEDSVREYLAERLGFIETVVQGPNYELDGCLLRFSKPAVLLEVKWRKEITQAELESAARNLMMIDAPRRLLFVQDKQNLKYGSIEIIDASDLLNMNF
ncbi:MAG: ATP-binding protein [Nitrososphaerota archaeon]|jgi:AAA+ ATPase superfamily predicted ATPase|nr:ATP-binding protein [Nitrososphaerota archaeon]MDG6936510.1 ATP-binding protein [Nitrososphaerota archaeon]MDG6944985.1 ATP-binding protein [Nitrososphaerota archaeon]